MRSNALASNGWWISLRGDPDTLPDDITARHTHSIDALPPLIIAPVCRRLDDEPGRDGEFAAMAMMMPPQFPQYIRLSSDVQSV
jgi:hypothetical protein